MQFNSVNYQNLFLVLLAVFFFLLSFLQHVEGAQERKKGTRLYKKERERETQELVS